MHVYLGLPATQYLSIRKKVVEKSEKELSDSFRQLLSALPTSEQCAAWFTQSAFHGGKSGHYLYKVRKCRFNTE